MYSLAVFLLCAAPILVAAKAKCQGLVWTIDEKLNMCHAKQCDRVAKGQKTFADYAMCQAGLPVDLFQCGGGMSDLGMCNTLPKQGPTCPRGQMCIWGPFGFGFCCDEQNEKNWFKEYSAECAAPAKTVQNTQAEGIDKVLRGKSCSDKFCPRGAKCVQGRYLAHCCV